MLAQKKSRRIGGSPVPATDIASDETADGDDGVWDWDDLGF